MRFQRRAAQSDALSIRSFVSGLPRETLIDSLITAHAVASIQARERQRLGVGDCTRMTCDLEGPYQ